MSLFKPRAVRNRLLTSSCILAIILSAFSCRSLHEDSGPEAQSEISVAEAPDTDLALDLPDATDPCAKSVPRLRPYFLKSEEFEADTLKHAMALYLPCVDTGAPEAFAALVADSRAPVRTLSWQLARARSGPAMAKAVGLRISAALGKAKLDDLATPVVAEAVLANRVPGSYTFLRQAFDVSQRAEFIKAMLVLDPEHARDDALSYLAKATYEELSSGELKHVDLAVCKEVLNYFVDYPPTLNHPNFGHLFLYAAAADKELASTAATVLAKMAGTNSADVASAFTKMAPDVQLAYAMKLRQAFAAEDAAPALANLKREIKARVSDAAVLAALEQSGISNK